MRTKISIIKKLFFIIIIFIIFILFIEICMRLILFSKSLYVGRIYDKELGWKVLPYVNWQMKRPGFGKIKFSTQKYGFRNFGNPSSVKFKIFCIGDSYTHGTTVNDGSVYYNYLKKISKNVEIFAYGCGGYGNYQEYLILNKYYDQIKPDLIIWQLAENDIINNDYNFEKSARDNNMMIRPYLENGQHVMRFPNRYKGLKGFLFRYSEIIRFFYIKFVSYKYNKELTKGLSSYNVLSDNKLIKKAKKNTEQIFKLIKKKCGKTPIAAFCTGSEKAKKFFAEILHKNNIFYLKNTSYAVVKAKLKDEKLDGMPFDAHWNDKGHKVAAQSLYQELINLKILP